MKEERHSNSLFPFNMRSLDLRQRTIVVLSLLFVAVAGFKVFHLKYTPAMTIPVSGYKVNISMQIEGRGEEVKVINTLPSSNFRQTIFDEIANSTTFKFTNQQKNGNRFGYWQASQLSGHHELNYTFFAKTRKVTYELPDFIPHAASYDDTLEKFLSATSLVQAGSPQLEKALNELQLSQNSDIVEAVKKVHDFTTRKIKTSDFRGKTDALTALQHGEANGIGKSHLFIAMMRTLGIPTRLVGGLLLEPGKNGIIHYWVEVYLANQWVPFDPANQYFAELPDNYLVVYYGEETYFQRTSNVNFKYDFNMERCLFPQENDHGNLARHSLNIMNVWPLLQRAGLSLELLRIILMFPVGAVVTIIFRNVIGLEIFGTFLPVLIAAAFQGTGLFWGLITFAVIILLGAVLGAILHRLRILYAPRLTIILVYVVLALLLISVFGMEFANVSLGHAALFPLAVMAITIERFSLIAEEAGIKKALTIFFKTIVTVIFCYLVINSLFLQTVVLAFPETLLLVISLSIYLGAWKGLRLKELIRFRRLIFR
jgi:hypothetical protein